MEIAGADGRREVREINLDGPETSTQMQRLFAQERVITGHSEEATLEDIFIHITGRGLV